MFVEVGPKAPRVSNIRVEYSDGIRQAVQHLAALRHERIGFITGPLRLRPRWPEKMHLNNRCANLDFGKARIHRRGKPHAGGRRTRSSGDFQAARPPDRLLCSNDMTAIGVMKAAFELGVEVPRALSVVGFDDIRMADYMIPPLTTIQMSQTELATLAFDALLKEVKRETPAPHGTEFVLKTRLILRSSTTFPPSHGQMKSRPP